MLMNFVICIVKIYVLWLFSYIPLCVRVDVASIDLKNDLKNLQFNRAIERSHDHGIFTGIYKINGEQKNKLAILSVDATDGKIF